MFVSLPNGNTVDISLEEYLSIPDENLFQRLMARDAGEFIDNPFTGSILHEPQVLDELLEEFPEVILEDETPDIPYQEEE